MYKSDKLAEVARIEVGRELQDKLGIRPG